MFKTLLCGVVLAVSASGAQAQGTKKGSTGAIEAPGCTTVEFRSGSMSCHCDAGFGGGAVWGSGPYTTDSNICVAARHAGAINDSGGMVYLVERPGQGSYTGSTANGVTTSDWDSYPSSFDVKNARKPGAEDLVTCTTIPVGIEAHSCSCPANPPVRSVWGNGPYTADSDLCSAAIHSGFLDSTGGPVHVLRLQGLASYRGDENNAVTTSDWNAFDSSIIFDWNR